MNDFATLEDIVIQDAVPVRAWLPISLRRARVRNFRRNGLGSRLLASTLDFAREAGAIHIEGQVTEPSPWLVLWYKSAGFHYDEATSTIRRRL